MTPIDPKSIKGMLYLFEDNCDRDVYLNAYKYRSILEDLRNYLRTDTKHGEGKYTEVYDYFFKLCNDEGIDGWEL